MKQAHSETGYPPLQHVEVRAHEKLVALSGRAPSYDMKQVAQCAAMSVHGVESLRNEIVVEWNFDFRSDSRIGDQ